MVDGERVDRLLDRLLADVRDVRATTLNRDELAADSVALRALKYGFVTIIEGASRVAQHIVVAQGWRIAETNADGFRRLATEEVLPADLAARLARAVGFRNILVHQYDDVRDDLVIANLDLLGDFESFAAQVSAWLSDRGSGPAGDLP